MTDINYLGTIPLGKINFIEPKKASTLTPVTFPGQDSDQTEAVDTLGIINYITVRGKFTGKFETIQGYLYDLRNILDGNQLSSQKFLSPFINGKESSARKMGNLGVNTTATINKLTDSLANFTTWNTSTDDKVKNLLTGDVANVSAIDSETTLTLSSDIFPTSGGTGVAYGVTGWINVKVLEFNYKWELPGLSFCTYEMTLIQVN